MTASAPPGDETIELRLTLPALAPYARVARLAMTGLASRNGLSYDEVEDLRIAIGEVFGMLVAPDGADLHIRFSCRLGTDDLQIVAERVPALPLAEVGELSSLILGAIVDEAEVDAAAGRIAITKRAGGAL